MSERSLDAIGARLKMLRAAQPDRPDQATFARSLGLAFNTYNNYERGHSRPAVDAALAICDRYQVTLDWIYTGNPAGLSVQVFNMLYKAA